MREVILVTAQKQTVMATDHVELRKIESPILSCFDLSSASMTADYNEVLLTETRIDLPVIAMHEEDESGNVESDYIALDPLMQKYYKALNNNIDHLGCQLKKANEKVELLQGQINQIQSESFWERLKRLFGR